MTSVPQRAFHAFLPAALAFLPLAGVIAPRALAFMPGVVALAGLALFYFAYRHWPRWPARPFFWALALAGFMFASMFWAVDPQLTLSRSLSAFLVMSSGMALYALGRDVDAAGLRLLQKIFPLILFFSALLCIVLFEGRMTHVFFTDGYATGEKAIDAFSVNLSGWNRGVVFLTLCALASFPLWRAPAQTPLQGYFRRASFVCFALVMLLTDSQSSQLALALGVLCYAVFPWRRRKAWLGLMIVLGLGVMLAPWLAQILFHNLALPLSKLPWFTSGYAHERLEIWDCIARKALEKPWLGHGIEFTRTMTALDMQHLFFDEPTVLHPHNVVMQIWIEFGAVGALLFAGLLMQIVWAISRLPGDAPRFALPVFVAVLTVACTTYGIWQGWWLGALVAVLCLTDMAARAALQSTPSAKRT